MEKYPCPCCGYLTYPVPREDAIAYICPVCFWENDVFVTSDDEPSDENHGISLRAAQAHLAVQRGVDGLDQRLAVAVERTAEGKVV